MNAYMKKHREVFEKKGEEISEALEEFVNAGTNKKRESLANLIARKYSNLITEIGMVHAFRRHLNDEQSIHPPRCILASRVGGGAAILPGFWPSQRSVRGIHRRWRPVRGLGRWLAAAVVAERRT